MNLKGLHCRRRNTCWSCIRRRWLFIIYHLNHFKFKVLIRNALSIAKLAHMYSRQVYTIKGPNKTTKCAGNNALLKSKIAMPIDVRLKQDISLHFQHKVAQRLKIEPMCFDQIIQTFGSEYPDITSLILMLEHNRIVSLNSLGKWVYNGW